ncbi:hypothetical protein RvY_03879 [Ramazzottius varieornatus]|uniref:Uncharacterized protein n=1 Tax=Ramazzottius varieornatus TaxID=947166 RepID=A0A1D1UPL4_RAMVA|nr:hypothetical protein RvY_03879 [Ramazzottius varieornatus]
MDINLRYIGLSGLAESTGTYTYDSAISCPFFLSSTRICAGRSFVTFTKLFLLRRIPFLAFSKHNYKWSLLRCMFFVPITLGSRHYCIPSRKKQSATTHRESKTGGKNDIKIEKPFVTMFGKDDQSVTSVKT